MHLRKTDVLFAHILLYDILMKYNEYFVRNDSYRIFTKIENRVEKISKDIIDTLRK